jgi:hypothetical protein
MIFESEPRIEMNRTEFIYLSYVNEFLTVERCAEYHCITPSSLRRIIRLWRNK